MEGWICPRCGRALAPFMIECGCEKKSDISYSDRTIPMEIDPGFYTGGTIGGWGIDKCVEEIKRTPITVLPKEEPKIVVEAKPQLPYNEVIAPLREKIMSLKRPDSPLGTAFEASVEARREAYNLAIDDILEMLDEEKDKTVVIEITAPCNHKCEVCEKACKEKKVNE